VDSRFVQAPSSAGGEERLEQRCKRFGCFFLDEVPAGYGVRADVWCPLAPDVEGVGELCLLGSGDDERRALDVPADPSIIASCS